MKMGFIPVVVLLMTLAGFSGCAKKADPGRPIDKIRKEVETMSVGDLEIYARAYADELRTKKAELDGIKEKMKNMPVQKIFDNNFMMKKVAKIGRDAGALFDRYLIYLEKLKEKNADLSKVSLE